MKSHSFYIFLLLIVFSARSSGTEINVLAKFESFRLVKVDPSLNELDYQALMSARHLIRAKLGTDWPSEEFTAAENQQTLVADLKQFDAGSNYTFHIFHPLRSEIIGCLYVTPSFNTAQSIGAQGFFWLTPEYAGSDIEAKIKQNSIKWLTQEFQFNPIVFDMN
jgi:hypothetical protein